VNMSLAVISSDPAEVAQIEAMVGPWLARAKAMGTAFIAAAGNSAGPVGFPARSPSVLGVSAIGKSGEFPPDSYHALLPTEPPAGPDGFFFPRFSCFGPEVAVAGPGVAVVSSIPGNTFVAWDGTSQAAPHVTGLAALVLAHNPDFQTTFRSRSSARVDHLYQVLRQSARPLNLGDRTRTGAGLPDAVAALQPMIETSQPRPAQTTTTAGTFSPEEIAAITQEAARIAAQLRHMMPLGAF
jgi:subtilisin